MRVIYPGSFDPVTNGHLDIIQRCSDRFDQVIISVLDNKRKSSVFTVDERIKLLEESTKELHNIEIDSFTGLLTDYAKKKGCSTIIRGLRAVSDFEYEMQLALINRKTYPDLETLFMVSSTGVSFLSSSLVREIASFNGEISCFVPEVVEDALKEKFKGGAR
ncbi:pantetheine-phosphate adenylyltransferase [Gudongella sp. DL1XJH-153]|uniref:pantetheine-phosphate adenylyltransferase n=1 Tax=Gudongella sp. DL1XJH-153 TaxID=3409804 RepID=UPI003BB75CCF